MTGNRRQANYELLRILSMFMVVSMHYLYRTDALLAPGEGADSIRLIGTLLESFCIVAVNVYVLISGYFLVEAGYKTKRILVLVCQVLFYAILIPLILSGAGVGGSLLQAGPYRLVQYLFPIETEHYWFATSYVFLYLFTPVLNAAVRNMSKKQLQITLGGLLLLFCAVKSISPVQFVTDRFGYDFGWFLCVYLTAAYVRLHGLPFLSTARNAFLTYVGCALLTFGIVCGFFFLNEKTGAFAYCFSVPFHYNFILCLAGAVALFMAFGHVRIPEGRMAGLICRISPLTFGVYLFHEHLDIRSKWSLWLDEIIGPAVKTGTAGFLAHLFLSVLIVYILGILVDALRIIIFEFIGRYLKKTRLARWVKQLDGQFEHGVYK